ncbi:MAG TPA: hypothetical protein VJ870_15425 [Amycolatopsis sp.]|nr:hypothetical protein [Amycolatopsis sp.]
MSTTLTVRVDEQTEHELAELTKSGTSRNAVITSAIHRAYREAVYEQMHREAETLRQDAAYQAEVRAARVDMGADSAW